MTIPAADRAVLDTNVLLAATDEARDQHESAVAALNSWPAAGIVLYTSGQILREYLAVATRPVDHNGQGLTQSAAVANAREFRSRLHLMNEDEKVSNRLLTLLGTVACAGKQVHDANVVATMLVAGVGTIVTANTSDFVRFSDYVQVAHLVA